MEPIKPGFGILERIKQTVIIPIREVTFEEILKIWLIDMHKSKKS